MMDSTSRNDCRARRIAVAVDEGEESMHALSWFLQNLAPDNIKTTIFLIHVKPPPPLYPALDGTGFLFSSDVIAAMEKYGKDLADSVMKRAREVYQGFQNHVQIVEKIGSGDARDVICDMVEKLGADLLVMGSHGYGFIKRALLGSVSDYCAKKVNCPVLIVKRPKK